MKIYDIYDKGGYPEITLSIDPGLRTGGFCAFDKVTKNIKTYRYKPPEFSNLNKTPFAELLVLFDKVTDIYLRDICNILHDFNRSCCEILIEIPHMQGSFSLGLSAFLTALISNLKGRPEVSRIILIPNRIGSFFLKSRTSSKSGIVNLIRYSKIQDALGARINSHQADAVIFNVFYNYQYFKDHFDIDWREPIKELIIIR